MSTIRKHVAVLALPASSHPRSLFTLLLKMATSAPTILFSFFNSEKLNNSLLPSSSREDLPENIKMYNMEDGVPPGHRFSGNHLELMDLFMKSAGEILRRRIQNVVDETGINLTSIITDAFLAPFVVEIVEEKLNNIPWIPVWTGLPCFFAAHVHLTQIIEGRAATESLDKDDNLDFIPGLPGLFRVKDIPSMMISKEGEECVVFLKTLAGVKDAISKATAVAVTSFEELNPEPLNKNFKSIFKEFLNLGIVAEISLNSDSDSDPSGCLSWLDRQPSKSVAYICFGTWVELPDKELEQLVEVLESTKIPFLWSLKNDLKEKLPNGFVERNTQGKIVDWTPQRLVLEHESIAVFISHSGFNAIRESIVHGVPMICRPMFGDQMMGARMVEDWWKIGVQFENGVITKDELLKSLELFLPADNVRGKKIRENVQDLKKVVSMASQPGGSATRDFNKLIQIISN